MLTVLTILSFLYQNPAPDSSFKRVWWFAATCLEPSTSLNGSLVILYDSASYVGGALKIEGHTIPFHGRHLGRRLALRTDEGFNPVIRVDCTMDSLGASFSGILQSSKVHAVDAHKNAKDFYDVIFQLYVVKSD